MCLHGAVGCHGAAGRTTPRSPALRIRESCKQTDDDLVPFAVLNSMPLVTMPLVTMPGYYTQHHNAIGVHRLFATIFYDHISVYIRQYRFACVFFHKTYPKILEILLKLMKLC